MNQYQTKLYMLPIKMMSIFAAAVFLFKKTQLPKYLANPLSAEPTQTSLSHLMKKKGSVVYWHTLFYVGVGSLIGAFFAK